MMQEYKRELPEKALKTGHIYIVDLKASERLYEWLLSVILLSERQITQTATLKIKSPILHNQVLCIQQALKDGKTIYADIAFNALQTENTCAEILEFNRVIIQYRN